MDLFQTLRMLRPATVVEVSSGRALPRSPVQQAVPGGRHVAVDADEVALRAVDTSTAAAQLPPCPMVCAELPFLPLPSRSFDAVVARGVLQGIDLLDAAVSELWRVVAPDGSLLVADALRPRRYPSLDVSWQPLGSGLPSDPGAGVDPEPVRAHLLSLDARNITVRRSRVPGVEGSEDVSTPVFLLIAHR